MMNHSENDVVAMEAIINNEAEVLTDCLANPLRPIIRYIVELRMGIQGTGDTNWERYEEPQALALTADHALWWFGNGIHGSALEPMVPDITDSLEFLLGEESHPIVARLFHFLTEEMLGWLWSNVNAMENVEEDDLDAIDVALLAFANKHSIEP